MTQKIAAFTLLAALLAAACSSGGGEPSPASETDGSGAAAPAPSAAAAVDPAAELAAAPDVTDGSDERLGAGGSALLDGLAGDSIVGLEPDAPLGTGGAALLGALNPLQLLGSGGMGISSAADPELAALLLQPADVPPALTSMGEFSFSTPSEYGEINMAATMFADERFEAEGMGEMVISMAIDLPAAALADVGELSDLAGFSDADLAELEALSQDSGVDFAKFEMLDASSLGDDVFGMHMEIDFSGLFSAFGEFTEDEELPSGFAIDMYGFLRGETMLMVMTMQAAGETAATDIASTVNTLALAQVMADRAGS